MSALSTFRMKKIAIFASKPEKSHVIFNTSALIFGLIPNYSSSDRNDDNEGSYWVGRRLWKVTKQGSTLFWPEVQIRTLSISPEIICFQSLLENSQIFCSYLLKVHC